MKPLGERILVKSLKEDLKKTEAGILIPSGVATGKENQNVFEAEVVEIPPTTKVFKSDAIGNTLQVTEYFTFDSGDKVRIKIGDKILCPEGYGISFIKDKIEHIFIRQSDIIAVL